MWLTEDEKRHIDYLFLEGSSMKTVSEAMALPLNTVRDYIARNYGSSAEKNIFRLEYIKQKLGIKGDFLSDEDAAKIYCHEGVSVKTLSAAMGVSVATFYKRVVHPLLHRSGMLKSKKTFREKALTIALQRNRHVQIKKGQYSHNDEFDTNLAMQELGKAEETRWFQLCGAVRIYQRTGYLPAEIMQALKISSSDYDAISKFIRIKN